MADNFPPDILPEPALPEPLPFDDQYVFVPSDLPIDPLARTESNEEFLDGLSPMFRLLRDAAFEALRSQREVDGINRDPLPITASRGLEDAFRASEHARVAQTAHELVERLVAKQWLIGMGCAVKHDPMAVELMMTSLAKRLLLDAVAYGEKSHQAPDESRQAPDEIDNGMPPDVGPKPFDDRDRFTDPRDVFG